MESLPDLDSFLDEIILWFCFQKKHAVYVQTCKLFADLERMRQEREMKDMHERYVLLLYNIEMWLESLFFDAANPSNMTIVYYLVIEWLHV